MIKLFRSAVLAGITIGVAGFGYLASGVQGEVYGTLVGAVLFCFGLLTVLGYRLALYTGTAGFIRKNEVGQLALILISNIFGCYNGSLYEVVSYGSSDSCSSRASRSSEYGSSQMRYPRDRMRIHHDDHSKFCEKGKCPPTAFRSAVVHSMWLSALYGGCFPVYDSSAFFPQGQCPFNTSYVYMYSHR